MENPIQNNSKHLIELIIRLAALFLLVFYCFQLLSPFIMPVLWAAIIAVAIYPIHHFMEKKLGGRKVLASVIVTLAILAFIFIPAGLFLASITDTIVDFKQKIESGNISLDHPSENIKTWPIIGNQLYDFLHNLSDQMVSIFQKYQSQVLTVAKTILMAIVGTGMSFLQVIFSIIIAGVLLATNGTEAAMATIFNKMVGEQGAEYLQLTTSTIRSVVKGVLGVAVIQTLLAGFGFFMAGIPHAGIWAVCALVLSIIQVGPGLVIIGVIGFLYTQENHFFATAWTVYFVLVMFSDNILKPILLGKGARVPMLVIFLGVIGGFLLQGFIGLFTGAIVLSIGYKLFLLWMHDQKIVS